MEHAHTADGLTRTRVATSESPGGAADELESIRARLFAWRQQHPELDRSQLVWAAPIALGEAVSDIAGNRQMAPAPRGGCVESALPTCPCGCGAPPLSVVGQGTSAVMIHEHGVTGECVAGEAVHLAAASAGKSGPEAGQPVADPAAYMTDAPGVRARTSRPGLLKRLGQLLDVVA